MTNSERDSYFKTLLDRQDSDFRDKILAAYSRRDSIAEEVDQEDVLVKGLEREVKQLYKDKQRLEKTWDTLRQLLDKFSAANIDKLRELLNKGVKSIFADKDFEVRLEISDTKRKQLKVFIIETKPDGEVVENNLSSDSSGVLLSGGGLLVTVSFIFQVYLIVHYERRRWILIDEGLTNLSSAYVENFFQFLKYLRDEMGFVFTFINHDIRFQQYFDKTYQVTAGRVRLLS